VDPVVSCDTCAQCRRGRRTACSAIEIIGVHRPGAFAEFVSVPAAQVHAIPDRMTWAAAASVEPLAQAVHDVGLGRLDDRPLGDCLVIGGGSIGSGVAAELSRLKGSAKAPARVIVVDTDLDRHAALRRIGTDEVVCSFDGILDQRFDTVFETVGVAETRRVSVELAAGGGTVVAVGLAEDAAAISWFDLVRREIVVRGANTFLPEDFASALATLSDSGPALVEQVVVPLEDASRVFADLASGSAVAAKFFVAPQR
jgi:threonine dehydrogenase-like Zn-dependent dehydrogenase